MAKVNLALLGGLRLQTDSGEPVPLLTKKAGALLAYLALHPGQAHARPKLATLLWGDRSEVQARESLRQALSLMRKALSHVDTRGLIAYEDTISFEPTALATDAIVFGDLVAQSGIDSMEEAIALYGGELLEGFQIAAPEFESWMTAERERFREMALEAMTKLLGHHLSMGAVERGIRIAARLLAADPLQERVHRTLMELYCRQGRHGAALRQYRTCADLLAKELGIDPDATTKALRREILREWNQGQRTTSSADAATSSSPEVEIGPPATPRALERRQVTVLVCDLASIGELAGRLDPEDLQALIAAYQRCCTPIISRFRGEVGKLSGAELLAYFGYPNAHEHDVECAVRAGLSLVEAVPKLDGGRAGLLQLRVGIATGPVVLGDLLGDGTDQHGIVGEAAQLAGSLETLAEPNTVVIAASSRQLIGRLFDCDDLGHVALKGFSEPVPVWRVLGTSSVDSRFEALRAATTPLIGRDEELELLLRRWRQAASGEGRVVLLSGEPGIGKSRIAQTVVDRLGGEPYTRLRYFCSPHHQDSALYPSITQLERAAGFRRGDTDEQQLNKLEAVLGQGTNDLSEAVPLLAALMSIPTGDRYRPLDLSPQKRKEKTLYAQLAQVEGLAARQPVLMVWEDVHWSDPTTRESLDMLIDRVPTLRLLLIITFRPEFNPPWVGRPHVTMLHLNRLPQRQCAEMIAHVTHGKTLPKEIADQIIDRTDGVPLFIEELTKAVVESGLVAESGDRYTVTGPLTPLAIPTSLHASLLARLDRLAPVREVAQIAAALGRQFSHELISAVASMPQRELDDALDQLVTAELIFRRGSPPDAEYTFKHALVQDAAYGILLREPRRKLHARIAETLEGQFPEIAESQPELVARHCTEAALIEKAAGLWGKAGQRSLERSALVEAVAQLTRALDQIATLPATPALRREQIKLQVALINPLIHVKGPAAPETKTAAERARLLIEQAEALGEPPEDPRLLFSVLYVFCAANCVSFNGDAMRELAAQFLALAEKQTATGPRLVGHTLVGQSLLHTGDIAEGRAHYDQALALYDPAEPRPVVTVAHDARVSILSHRSIGLWSLGYPEAALADADRALKYAREIGHAATLMFALTIPLFTHIQCGSYAIANLQSDEVVALGDKKDTLFWKAQGMVNQGCVSVLTGKASDAVQTMNAGITAYRSKGASLYTPLWLSYLAKAYAELDQFDGAWRRIGEAMSAVATTKERWCEAEVYRTAGEIASLASELDAAKAQAYFERALSVARAKHAKSWELRAAMSLARLWRDQGKAGQARELLAPVYGWFTEGSTRAT